MSTDQQTLEHIALQLAKPDHSEALVSYKRILTAKLRLTNLRDELRQVPDWTPGKLLDQTAELAEKAINTLAEQPDRKLIVSIIGATGAGKSTLLNALAKKDHLSATGVERPTTRKIKVFAAQPEDADFLRQHLGSGKVEVISSPVAKGLKHLLLIDTPDTNSVEGALQRELVSQVIGLSDVLLCLFPADAATTRDQIDFLAPLVSNFPHEWIFGVITRSEQLPADELRENVLVPLDNLLGQVWSKAPRQWFAVSARSHLTNPNWRINEEPCPDAIDQFSDLSTTVLSTLDQAAIRSTARAARAEVCAAEVILTAEATLRQRHSALKRANDALQRLSSELWRVVAESGFAKTALPLTGIESILARLWWGPAGWLLAIWAFILRLLDLPGALMSRLERKGSFFRTSPEKTEPLTNISAITPAITQAVEDVSGTLWPDIELLLLDAGFSAAARENPLLHEQAVEFSESYALRAQVARQKAAELMAIEMSGFATQIFINILLLLPFILIMLSGTVNVISDWTLPQGFANDSQWFIGLWIVLTLTAVHAWVKYKEKYRGKVILEQILPEIMTTHTLQLTGKQKATEQPSLQKQLHILLATKHDWE